MLIFEFNLKAKIEQFKSLDEPIRTGQFIRNACLKYWNKNRFTPKNTLQKYGAVLAANPDLPRAKELNSMARQVTLIERGLLYISCT